MATSEASGELTSGWGRPCEVPSAGLRTAPKRPPNFRRLRTYDYSRGASLFITITTEPRRQLFGAVNEAQMALSAFGREVDAAIRFTFSHVKGFRLYGFVVMPDHVHFRIYLEPGVDSKRAPGVINSAVGRFKSYTTHLYQTKYGGHGALWQASFHDWVCRGREMIDSVERYMAYNALKWWLRNGAASRGGDASRDGHSVGGRGLLALREPLTSARLGGLEFWRGVGAVGLLDEERLMVSLRVSRRCSPDNIAALRARLLAKAGELTVISGFISAGEREILDGLLRNPSAKIVKVSPYALAHDYSPPVTLLPAIAEGRLAIIARGNSPEEISRTACLDLNARIVEIADRAAYQLPGELKWLR